MSSGLFLVFAVVYVALFLTLGITALRKGHWLWFVVGELTTKQLELLRELVPAVLTCSSIQPILLPRSS